MLAKFIGANGSMGLIHGKTYAIEIDTQRADNYIWVRWYDTMRDKSVFCPYSSVKKLSENWE